MAAKKNRRILRLPEVMERTSLGRDSIYRLGHEGRFPRPVKLGVHASGWFADEIDDYMERIARERQSPAAPQAAQA